MTVFVCARCPAVTVVDVPSVEVQVSVISLEGLVLATVTAQAADKVLSVKERLAQEMGVPAQQQQLIWQIQTLANDARLWDIDGLLQGVTDASPRQIDLHLIKQKAFEWMQPHTNDVEINETRIASNRTQNGYFSVLSADTCESGRHLLVLKQVAEQTMTHSVRCGICERGEQRVEQLASMGVGDGNNYSTAFYYAGMTHCAGSLWQRSGAGIVRNVSPHLPRAAHVGVEIALTLDADVGTLSVSIDGSDAEVAAIPHGEYHFAISMHVHHDAWEVVRYELL